MNNPTCSKKEQIRLVDANALWESIKTFRWQGTQNVIKFMFENLEFVIDNQSTIDPESLRPQGKWVEAENRSKSMKFICSECAKIAYFPQPTRERKWTKHCGYNYCPNCGAQMKEE